ncbi:MAG: response regulator transcription factor [Planctomycetes bacterium]|nr:response regulator transcription factor [Planctomycetota bacterium]
MARHRILVIEDDPAIQRGIVDAVEFAGYAASACGDGVTGLERARAPGVDLVVLDVMLPGRSGLDVLRELRRCRPTLPVVMVTAKGAESDRVAGLELGADDYVVKPFSARELLARIKAVLRRSAERPLDVAGHVVLARRRIDFERREVALPDGTRTALSEREAELLRYLVTNPGRAVSRDEILRSVWGLDPHGVRHTRTIDMHIARLREKLGDDADEPTLIATVRGKGYMVSANALPDTPDSVPSGDRGGDV